MDLEYLQFIQSDRVSAATQRVLLSRAAQSFGKAPLVIEQNLYPILQAVIDRMVPQADRAEPIDLAAWLDHNLSCKQGNGWRYADMPADGDALQAGLTLLEKTALKNYGANFARLSSDQQDELLQQVQSGDVHWPILNAERWFEELLTDATELFVSHPDTLAEIGFSGIAILPRWERVGLNETEPWEPRSK